MQYKVTLLLTAFVLATTISFCQTTFEKEFNRDIVDKTWSAEDTAQKADYETMYVLISKDSLTIAYLNWIEGMSVNQCSYSKKDLKKCFELTIGNCVVTAETKFIYGYMSEDKKTLNLLLADDRITSIEKIKTMNGWLYFTLLKE